MRPPEPTEPAGPATTLRLLPWPSPEGKPCYLATDGEGGYVSRLADEMEAVQLTTATDLLGHARKVLACPTSPPAEVRFAAVRLAECLSDALRVAESRGGRLGMPSAEAGEGDEDTDE
ncbi:hypothetical protein Sipo8835_38355 [Streptomyces ipomoeae]|uniref:Uncharacterized protein n=1 Tax=Streptomyces ipomoeae TaxID=103232 RepID=A0AAE8VXP6_9ACTN|nr:hypothetical protein Sipo8835_38355 [Streptomyces ipomoeae]TQE27937.1 hypothetical protein Sipo7851_31420 [Streptomyces ipomoeae]